MNKYMKTLIAISSAILIGGGGTFAGLKIVENNKLKADNLALVEENEKLNNNKIELVNQVNDLIIQKTELQNGLTNANTLLSEANSQKEYLNKRLYAKTEEYNLVFSELQTANEDNENLLNQKNQLQSDINDLQDSIAENENIITTLNNTITTLNNTIDDLQARIDELSEDIGVKYNATIEQTGTSLNFCLYDGEYSYGVRIGSTYDEFELFSMEFLDCQFVDHIEFWQYFNAIYDNKNIAFENADTIDRIARLEEKQIYSDVEYRLYDSDGKLLSDSQLEFVKENFEGSAPLTSYTYSKFTDEEIESIINSNNITDEDSISLLNENLYHYVFNIDFSDYMYIFD